MPATIPNVFHLKHLYSSLNDYVSRYPRAFPQDMLPKLKQLIRSLAQVDEGTVSDEGVIGVIHESFHLLYQLAKNARTVDFISMFAFKYAQILAVELLRTDTMSDTGREKAFRKMLLVDPDLLVNEYVFNALCVLTTPGTMIDPVVFTKVYVCELEKVKHQEAVDSEEEKKSAVEFPYEGGRSLFLQKNSAGKTLLDIGVDYVINATGVDKATKMKMCQKPLTRLWHLSELAAHSHQDAEELSVRHKNLIKFFPDIPEELVPNVMGFVDPAIPFNQLKDVLTAKRHLEDVVARVVGDQEPLVAVPQMVKVSGP